MRDLNTVGLKGAAESKRGKMMGSPRPSYGRAGNYEYRGLYDHGRSGTTLTGGQINHHSYTLTVSAQLQVVVH